MSKVFLSEHANPMLADYLKSLGYSISFVYSASHTYDPVSSHPDIYMCRTGLGEIFYGDPGSPGPNYPDNIKYNAACVGKYFIHRLGSTSKDLLDHAKHSGKILIDVPQGYTKCNMVVVGDRAAITSDRGIAKALAGTDIDLLLVSPGHVRLRGYSCGFIGGASGQVGNDIVFHGNLAAHPDFNEIADFLEGHGCGLKYFEEFELEDIGSIIWA